MVVLLAQLQMTIWVKFVRILLSALKTYKNIGY